MVKQQLVYTSLQCSSITVCFGQCKTLAHWLDPGDFYFLSRMNSASNWHCLIDAINSIKNVTEELKILSKNGFQECFQQLYSHWQKCIFGQGATLKEMLLKLLYTFVLLRNNVILGIFWNYHYIFVMWCLKTYRDFPGCKYFRVLEWAVV